jgi:hypothetical protein
MSSIKLPNGKYYYVIRSSLVIDELIGKSITHPNPRFSGQCATGGQFLAGTEMSGRIYDVPSASTWHQGQLVNDSTPHGTLIARGWQDGAYPNKPASSHAAIVNHVGIFLGFDKPDHISVLDQFVGGKINIRPYPVSEGWSQVLGTLPHDSAPSQSRIS